MDVLTMRPNASRAGPCKRSRSTRRYKTNRSTGDTTIGSKSNQLPPPPRTSGERIRPRLDAVLVALALLLASVVGVIGVHDWSTQALTSNVRGNLRQIALAAAATIDGDLHATLRSPEQHDSDAYNRCMEGLRQLHNRLPEIKFIYTFAADGNKVRFVLDTALPVDSDLDGVIDQSKLWEEYEDASPDAREMIKPGAVPIVSAEPWTDRWGTFLSAYAPIYDSEGRVTGAVGIDLDAKHFQQQLWSTTRAALVGLVPCLVASLGFGLIVYRQRRKEQADRQRVEQAQRAAETASQAKSDFLANMSHEIRTPMTVVIGYAELLEDENVQPEDRREYVRNIQRSGHHLVGLINDILDVAKIEAGKIEVHRTPCDPAEILNEVDAIMRQRASSKGLTLEFRGLDRLPGMITTDAMRLRQILVNLIGNAIKFTDTGGVTVIASFSRDELGGRLEVCIQDTGIGIAPETLRRLFKPFEQAEVTSAKKFSGTGLGLFITRRLAIMLGGGVEVVSTPDVGSVFTVWIDAGEEVAPATPAESPEPEVDYTTLKLEGRVLLADDTVDSQRLIAHMLRTAGAEIDIVSSGAEALERVRAATLSHRGYDMVLLDIQMPGLDGYATAQQLREQGYTNPILAITAYAMSSDRQKCLAAGCSDFLAKPFRRQELLTVCRQHLRASQRQSSAASSPRP